MDWATALRDDLRVRAFAWAAEHAIPHYVSLGTPPTVLFERALDGSAHGSFQSDSWRAILDREPWRDRLTKPHSQSQALPPDKAPSARELDSSNSSDALLMNCFCFPSAAARILNGLGIPCEGSHPEFGIKARLPLVDGSQDATEIDMQIGSHLFEAKLTERDFTSAARTHVARYRDVDRCFDISALPVNGDDFVGYQLIRNVLAAAHHNASLTILIDQRRPDLLQEWWKVHSAILTVDLRRRCGFRTWQQVAAASPPALAEFLSAKYGL
jgi:restriction endonuclease-like protein